MRIYEAIVKGLEGIGVDTIFGGAGQADAALMLALQHSAKITPIITRNEQAASFMACGYTMFSNRLGVCFATAGPGAFNLISGLSVALTDSYPVLAITGSSWLKWRGKAALNETSGLMRTPNAGPIFSAITKKSYELTRIEDTCDVLEEAVNIALEGRPGPVHIAVPQDLAEPQVSVDNYHDIRLTVSLMQPDPAVVSQVAEFLADALQNGRQVLLLAGYGAIRSQAGSALRELAERYQIPVVTTMDGKGIIPEDHGLAVGVLAESGHVSACKAFHKADIVLAIGNSFAEHATFEFKPDLFHNKRLIQINIDPNEIGKVYQSDYSIVADAKLAITALTEALSPLVDAVPTRRYETQNYETERILHLDRKLHPGDLVLTLSKMLPDNAVALGDAGTHSAWLNQYLELSRSQNFRKPGTFGPMAEGVNAALGVKCAAPERTVVVGCGDGCYLMSGFELMTAVQYGIPVIWIIFNDSEFKLIKLEQLQKYHQAALVEFNNPDYVAYAKACGAEGYRVETIEEFETAFQSALQSGKPCLIDAAISRLAVPRYIPSPEGFAEATWEAVRKWFGLSSL
jgi:acetolactate synthase-1/2/3 large subunit